MYKELSSLFLIILLSSSSFGQKEKGKFKIIGSVTGFPDSTVIFLYHNHLHQADLMDSAFIINNAFQFHGSLGEPAINAILQISSHNAYKYFWLENATITFTAKKEDFRNAVITGSVTENEQKQLDSAREITGRTEKENCIAYILSHPNSIISVYVLGIYDATWGKDTAANLYHRLSPQMQQTSFGKEVLRFITLNKNPRVGDKYVDFTEPNVEGKNVSLSGNFKGKVILLDFWGSWCGACREGNPELKKVYNEFSAKGFDILGVAADVEKSAWVEAIKKDGLIWENVSDLKGWNNQAALIYGIYKYPTNYLIDRNGTIVAMDLDGDGLRRRLGEMLK